ncbi:MAG: PspC domain-containing protein [Propionibacteriaceae bacterium]|jgi:phage shock protein PspC (stress-responsive transcriptional regulator)|nr:PspC domain-containing protein [Propionibacteriaceae bacterium]
MSNRRFCRSRSNRILGGVAGGIADYFGLDVTLTRLIVAAVVIFTGVGLIGYILAWIIIPAEGASTSGLESIVDAFRNGSQSNNSNPNPNDYR